MTQFISTLVGIFQSSGFARSASRRLAVRDDLRGLLFAHLAIVKEFEP